MAKTVYTDAQVVTQLDSKMRLPGTNLTYGFPTTASGWFPNGEAAGFSALNATQQAMATQAIKLWDDLISVNFTLAADGTTANVKYSNTTTNIGYAQAYYPGSWSYASSVWFNPNYNSGTNNLIPPSIGAWGWSAYVHETGHAMGLSHPGTYNGGSPTYDANALYMQDSQQYTIMSYFTASNTGADWVASNGLTYYAQTPMIDDIMAVQAMYGVSTTTRTGDTTYGFNSSAGATVFDFTQNLHPIVAIFDSGGVDRIDVSGWNTASLINLTPGSFSNADMMTYNISIARTAWIENAVTGGGDDTLIGNALANLLNGNAGNDSFTGGAGNDTIQGGIGTDTAIFSGTLANYTIVWNSAAATFTITDNRGGSPDGTDTLTGVENFAFSDQSVASSLYQGTGGTSLSIAATDATKSEGNTGSTPFTFTITRSGVVSAAGSVNWAVTGTGANAAGAADFGGTLPSGTVNFAAGQTSAVVTVNVTGDTAIEATEGFTVTLSGATGGATIAGATAVGSILTDDVAPSLAIAAADAVKAEGDTGITAYTFTVTRSGNTSAAGTVNWAVTGSGANAANGTDFGGTLPTGVVNFGIGQTTATITVNVAADSTAESDEGFAVTLSGATGGATISTASATGTILNNDGTFAIAATSASKAEGNSGTTPFTFTVTRSGPTTTAAAVNWTVSGVSADAADFGGTLPSGTLNFGLGQTTATITVNVASDAAVEGNETFMVTLSAPSGGMTPTNLPEGDYPAIVSGNQPAGGGFSLRCSCPICSGTAPATTAAPAGRKAALHAGLVNQTNQPNGAVTIATATATGTILNDDASLAITADAASKTEGNAGTTPFTFTVTRTGNISGTASANWAVAGTGADAADFGGTLPTGTVNFGANQATATITVNVAGDAAVENNEGFTVTLSNPSGATVTTASATSTILNDDAAPPAPAPVLPTLSVLAGVSKAEGNSGTTPFTFTVSRSGDTSGTSSANWTATGNGADAADFGGIMPSGTVNFTAGQTTTTITVNVAGDTAVESSEGFTITLSNATGATITTASASGTIQNDDASLAIVADAASKAEGNAGTTPFTFTVTRSGNISGTASANWAVTGSGADAADFGGALPTGSVTFAANQASAVVTVNVSGDTVSEGNDGFTVTLSNAIGATIATASATSTILNDDTVTGFAGTAGNDVLDKSAMTQNLSIDLSQGGNDSATGGSGNDSFVLGAAFTAADSINGGTGTDSVSLSGNYTATTTFGAATLTNIETLTLGAGGSYGIITNDATVAAGANLTVDATALANVNVATVNGSLETNGSFTFLGGAGADYFTGGAGNDTFRGGLGADILASGAGSDRFIYTSAAESALSQSGTTIVTAGADRLSTFSVASDRIDLVAFGFTGAAASLATKTTSGFTTTATTGFFGGSAVAVEYALRGNTAQVYVDVNRDGNLGSGDLLLQLTGVARNTLTGSNLTFA